MSDSRADDEGNHWSLDKRIPIALMLGLAANVIVVVWRASALNSTVGQHDRRLSTLEQGRIAGDTQTAAVREALAELRAQQAAMTAAMTDLKRAIERLSPMPGDMRR